MNVLVETDHLITVFSLCVLESKKKAELTEKAGPWTPQ